MQAHILIGIEFALPMKHADLASRMADNAAFAVGELRGFGNEHFRHVVWFR
jgi:hypothetical protein